MFIKNSYIKRVSHCVILSAFVFSQVCGIAPQKAFAQSALNLPLPGTMVAPSVGYTPVMVSGITIYPENPLQIDFIIDTGDDNLQGGELRQESKKLINYFLATLTVPEDEMWVNLSPYEKDRIIADGLGVTEMGRDMLAQDYMLKQFTASLMYPETALGSEFWNKVYEQAQEKFGTTEIPVNTFNKVWIVPEKAVVYINGTSVFVSESHLKVMLEEDYLALESNKDSTKHGLGEMTAESIEQLSADAKEIIREVIIPEIEKEVNEGKNFANLRQIYNSMILAAWYKKNLRESILGSVYMDSNKTSGIDLEDKNVKEKFYSQYVEAFQKGVYDYIKEDYDETTQEVIPRKYFSGGLEGIEGEDVEGTRSEQARRSVEENFADEGAEYVVRERLDVKDGSGNVITQGKTGGDFAMTAKSNSSPTKLLAEQAQRIDDAFEKYKKRYLDALYGIKPALSIAGILEYFQNDDVPEGTMRRTTETDALALKELRHDGMNKLDFEFSFWRIRGTNDWIIVKGQEFAVQNSIEIGVEGEEFGERDRVEVPFYMFDVVGHNHPHETRAIPSYGDMHNFFFKNNGGNSRFLIRAQDGMTIVSLQNAVDKLGGEDFKLVMRRMMNSISARIKDELGIDMKSFSPKDEQIRPYWEDALSALEKDGLLSMQFVSWEEMGEELFPKIEFRLSDLLQDESSENRLRAFKVASDLFENFDVKFRMSLFKQIAQDSSEHFQDYILYNMPHYFDTLGERSRAVELFLESPNPTIRAMASVQVLRARFINERVPEKYNRLIDNGGLEHLEGVRKFRLSIMIGFHLDQGIEFGMRIDEQEVKKIGRSTLEMYLSRLREAGMNREGENDPLVQAAEHFRAKWGFEQAMTAQVGNVTNGGIDFNPGMLDLGGQGGQINFTIDNSMLQNLQPNSVQGIKPVIINIAPILDYMPLLGLSNETDAEPQQLSKLENASSRNSN